MVSKCSLVKHKYSKQLKMLFKWKQFLFLICAIHAFGLRNSPLKRDFNQFQEGKISDFKVKLKKIFEELAFLKNAMELEHNMVPYISTSRIQTRVTKIISKGCTVQVYGADVIFVVTSGNSSDPHILSELRNATIFPIFKFQSYRAFLSLQALTDGRKVTLIAQHPTKTFRYFINIYEYDFRELKPKHKIRLNGLSLVSATKIGTRFYMVTVPKSSAVPTLKVYQLAKDQYNDIAKIKLKASCSGLETWNFGQTLYIALSYVDSGKLELLKLLEYSGNFSSIQVIDVYAFVLKLIQESGNTYLICGTRKSVIVYWWTGYRFREMHSKLFQKEIVDVTAHTFLGQIVIAVALQDEVEFLTQDSSARYVSAGNRTFFYPADSIKSVLLWNDRRRLLMMPLFKEKLPLSVFEIDLRFDALDPQNEHALKKCIDSLELQMIEREKWIDDRNSKCKKMWRSSKTSGISHLIVNGSIKSFSNSTIRSLHLDRYFSSNMSLRSANVELRDFAISTRDLLSDTVRKSVEQRIHCDLRFSKLKVLNGTVGQLLNHAKINDVSSRRLSYALKKTGQQVFPYKTLVFAAKFSRVTTNLLNEKRTEEYVLLNKGSWNMTGHFTFNNMSANNVSTYTINDIDVHKIVLRSGSQEIEGLKSFRKLNTKFIRTTEQQKMHLDRIKDLVYLETMQFRTPMNFEPELRIKGKLTVSLLNGESLTRQFFNSVRRNEDVDIFGSKVFHSVVVNGSTLAVDGINGFSTKNLMTVNNDQYIAGNVTFSDATFYTNIETVSLNGHDLKSEALTLDSETEIKGVKTFQENLKVSDIIMEDGIQIDYFDPSEEKSRIVFKVPKNASSQTEETFSYDVRVGNIIANTIKVRRKKFPILKELDNVWLKTKEQNLTFFKTEKMTVRELNVSNVNGIEMQSFVPVSEDSNIEGTITFTQNISTKTISLQKTTQVDFPPEFWNPDIKVKISDNITLENPVMEGNVTVIGIFENFETGFMNTVTMQDIKGPVEFWKVKLNELNAKDLKFNTLNEMNFTEYYDRSVLLSKNKQIFNKTFNALKGTAMNCYGTFNNVTLDKIATINTPQNLTSSYQLYNSTFKNISLNFLNGMQLEKVVCKDEKRSISNKHFKRSIVTLSVSTDENINGVNLTKLNEEAFSTNGTNETRARITFRENITLDELQVSKNKTIDGVSLANLIMINETTKLESFNVSIRNASINAENVTVKGLINGCNVNTILKNVLLLKQDAQNITSKVHVNTLEVHGNLTTKRVNGADIAAWIAFLNTVSTTDTDSDVTFEHLMVDHIHILDTVNNISLEFLFLDSVRKNSSQEISGLKRFEDIEVKNVNMSSLDSDKICGIDLQDLYENTVNKTAKKEIILHSNLFLGNLTIKNVTIDGKLNEIKFPDDAILSNVSEHIDCETILNSTMNATAGLIATGSISGVDMKAFLQDRVTLEAPEMISAELIFENDVIISGNTSVDGLINKISLHDVVEVLRNDTISGQKTFKEELNIKSRANVSGHVNQLLIDPLDKSILRVTRNETSLKGVVKFSNLNLSSLMSVTINGINVVDFYNNSHSFVHEILDKMSNFSFSIQTHRELMQDQRDTVEHPLSFFNSFELQELMNFHFIEKFLPIYEYGAYGPKHDLQVTGMILWVKLNKTKECRSTRSIIADVSSDGSFNETSRKWGKFFLFSLSTFREDVIGFSVQAEYTNCTEEQQIRIAALNRTNEIKVNTIKPIANATLLDVHLLEDEDVFLVFSYSKAASSENPERIFLFRYDTSSENWTSHQNFFTQEMTSVNIISVERDGESWNAPPSIYLSVTGQEVNPGVTIYEWDKDQFYPKTSISTTASSYSCWVVNDNTLYLLLSKEKKGIKGENGTRTVPFSETLEVYTLDEELILNHTVKVNGVTSMDMFMLAEETFVLATSNQKGMVYVLQFRGYNGFEVIQEILSPGVSEARVFTVDGHLYVGINSKTGPSKILKATISGGRQGFELYD